MFLEGTKRARWAVGALLLLLLVGRGSSQAEEVRTWELATALPVVAVALPRVSALEERAAPHLLLDGEKAELRSEKEKRFSRRRPYLTAALAVSSAAVAWWSKEKADRAYDRYLRAASVRRQEQQFERAERYDRIAGATFVYMEVGLVITTYLIFY